MIVYLRVLNGFGVAVEESRNPELHLQPLIIGGLPQQRGIVREANPVAQRSGVRPGMTLTQAHQHCPNGVFRHPDLSRYEAIWEQICEIVRLHTPLVEPVELGEAVCDVSGCKPFQIDGRRAARALAAQICRSTGIVPSIGIASNRIVAELASLYPDEEGISVVERGDEQASLADLPLTLLPGVDSRLALTCTVLGLTTISHFAALPISAVKQRFGALGEQLHRYARGIDPRPVLPPPGKDEVVARYECEDGSIEEAMDGVRRLADSCAGALQERRVAGLLVGLRLIWREEEASMQRPPQGESTVQQIVLPSPYQSPSALSEASQEAFPVPYRVHSMLPQPLQTVRPQPLIRTGMDDVTIRTDDALPAAQGALQSIGRMQEAFAMVRTPIDTAPPLRARAEGLLIRNWPRARSAAGDGAARLLAIELRVGEFAKPSQLALSDFDRLDEVGMLQGLSTERRQTLTRYDDAFQARYGKTAFSHVAAVDSANILTERRFRWDDGLPWPHGERRRKRP
jgi:DNA polymerase-4